jgi:hypothetical protein
LRIARGWLASIGSRGARSSVFPVIPFGSAVG